MLSRDVKFQEKFTDCVEVVKLPLKSGVASSSPEKDKRSDVRKDRNAGQFENNNDPLVG